MTISLEHLVETARATMLADQARCSSRQLEADVLAGDATRRDGGRLRARLEGEGMSVIAELKCASPVAGPLRENFAPLEIAQGYAANGAAAISVLTEPTYFRGSLQYLSDVSAALDLPTLRKDFIVDEYQILQAAAAGAAAVLLIAEVLDARRLRELVAFAHDLRLDALVELHGIDHLDSALESGSGLVGVNNRDLRSMQVDWTWSLRVAESLPASVVAVAESGIDTHEQLLRLHDAGYAAALVGTRLIAQADPGAALRQLLTGGA